MDDPHVFIALASGIESRITAIACLRSLRSLFHVYDKNAFFFFMFFVLFRRVRQLLWE